jgi:enamine deaminase RidA (YjgF/YER057c/UK114 family)
MSSPNHYNTTAGSPPYKDLFRTVTVVPKDREIAYISTQWAADATGKLDPSTKNDYFKQAAVTWTHINAILVELGIEMKDIVHRTVSFL